VIHPSLVGWIRVHGIICVLGWCGSVVYHDLMTRVTRASSRRDSWIRKVGLDRRRRSRSRRPPRPHLGEGRLDSNLAQLSRGDRGGLGHHGESLSQVSFGGRRDIFKVHEFVEGSHVK